MARGFRKLEDSIRYITYGNTRVFDAIDHATPSDLMFSSLEARKELREQAWRIDGWAETVSKASLGQPQINEILNVLRIDGTIGKVHGLLHSETPFIQPSQVVYLCYTQHCIFYHRCRPTAKPITGFSCQNNRIGMNY